jgi:hypothetical protein
MQIPKEKRNKPISEKQAEPDVANISYQSLLYVQLKETNDSLTD